MFDAVFFDLDGTLVDTARDFERTISFLLAEDGKPPLPFSTIRHYVSAGARAMTQLTYGISPESAGFDAKCQHFLDVYAQTISNASQLFDGMEEVLHRLRQNGTPWGVVTNKPVRFTTPIMQALQLADEACAIICPDHVTRRKPDPEGLFIAAKLANVDPTRCLYIGDHLRDIDAGKNAGMLTAAAAYGYIAEDDNAASWQADYTLATPQDLLPIL